MKCLEQRVDECIKSLWEGRLCRQRPREHGTVHLCKGESQGSEGSACKKKTAVELIVERDGVRGAEGLSFSRLVVVHRTWIFWRCDERTLKENEKLRFGGLGDERLALCDILHGQRQVGAAGARGETLNGIKEGDDLERGAAV
jgi:hypothetical protein